ncbi:MAG: restriction endonuclease [Chloroflexi bacterium]|nr:restriction endonuclease [Chloroflexota bacterium]
MEQRLSWRFSRQMQTRIQQSSRTSKVGLTVLGMITAVFAIWKLYRWILEPAWILSLPNFMIELVDLGEVAGAFSIAFLWVAIIWRQRQPEPHQFLTAVNIDMLYALSPADFEKYVGQLFTQRGYRVTLRGRSGDKGVDLELINKYGKRAIVQCKRYRNTVGAETVRELYGTLIHEKVAHAFLVTTAPISSAARLWAKGKPITLIDGTLLVSIATSQLTNR